MGTMATPFKHQKTGVYYCRVSVPKELRDYIGKSELKRTLKTKDIKQARRLFPEVYSEFNSTIETARRRYETEQEISKRKTTSPDKLTMFDIQVLASRYFNDELKSLRNSETFNASTIAKYDLILVNLGDWKGNSGITEEDFKKGLEETEDMSATPLESNRNNALVEYLGDTADKLLIDNGYAIPRKSNYYQTLIAYMALKVQKLSQLAMEFYSNNFSNSDFEQLANSEMTPPASQVLKTKGTAPLKLFEDYQEDLKLRKKGQEKTLKRTLKDYEVAVKRFAEFTDNKPIEQVVPRDIAEFRDLLLRLPTRPNKKVSAMSLVKQVEYAKVNELETLKPKTVRKLLMALSAVFDFAREQTLIELNPVLGSTKRLTQSIKQRSGKDKEYQLDDLVKIFSSPIFSKSYRPPVAEYGEAVYWIPLISYYTGARREEVSQLYVHDVKKVNDIYYLKLEANDSDKSLKNKASARVVPIHDDLLSLGFLDYVKSLDSSERLFPKLTIGSDGTYGFAIGKWLTLHFREKLKISADLQPIHAFRHTFKTNARMAGMPKDIYDVLTGHTAGDVSSSYGHYPIELLHKEINKIPSIPVELSKVKWKGQN